MKSRRYLLILAAGLSLAWVIHRGNHPASKPDAFNNPPTKAARTREHEAIQTVNWRDFGKRSMAFGDEERVTFVKNLAPKDRTRAMEALAAQAGRDGLDSKLKSMMEEILRTWATEDFDSAWSWSQRNTEPVSRRYVMEVLLATLVGKDPERALALYLNEKGEYPDFDSSVPFSLIVTKTREGAGEFIDLFSKLPMGDRGSFGTMEFAKDFDFRLAADGVVTSMKGRENERPPAFPDNFFQQWATRDSEASFAWWAANRSLPENDWVDLIIGVEKSSTPEAAGEWAAGKLEESANSREKMIRELTATTGRNNRTIQKIAEGMPDPAIRDRFLTDILVMNHNSDPTSTYNFAIPELSSPQARLETFKTMKAAGKSLDAETINSQSHAWGLTRDQVSQVFGKN